MDEDVMFYHGLWVIIMCKENDVGNIIKYST